MHLWDRLLQQSTLTLNILRPLQCNPQVLAYTMLKGQFDFNKTPMAPPVTKGLLHEKPVQQKSWNPHGYEGWYLGPALEHYRCYRVYKNRTRAEIIVDTVEFFHKRPQYCINPLPMWSSKPLKRSNRFSKIQLPPLRSRMLPIINWAPSNNSPNCFNSPRKTPLGQLQGCLPRPHHLSPTRQHLRG